MFEAIGESRDREGDQAGSDTEVPREGCGGDFRFFRNWTTSWVEKGSAMDVTESSRAGGSAGGRGSDEPPVVEPLTRNGYKRLAEVERQISDALTLGGRELVGRARQREEGGSDFPSPEALVYFIRRAIRNGDERIRNDLFRELLERCNPHFRGKFRGFGPEDRQDLQGDVQLSMIEDLFAQDDRSDFMQVRFWTYLERKCTDARRARFGRKRKTDRKGEDADRDREDSDSLEVRWTREGVVEGLSTLEEEVDRRLSSEDLARIVQALSRLPQQLRVVFLLRYYFLVKIGSDDLAKADGGEATIAEQFGCTGRTVRNWLKEADSLLAEFRENQDGK